MSSDPIAASAAGFPRSRAAAVPLQAVGSTGSTNADMLAAAAELPHAATLATLDQTAGRGRLDRRWVAPPGQTLAVSVLVRADLGTWAGWLPLVAGAAMRDAVAELVPHPDTVAVKWPNDVLIDGRKVSGILCQIASDGSVVVGAGVNLTIPAEGLPTAAATSLQLEGAVHEAGADPAPAADAGLAAEDADAGFAAELADRVLVRYHGLLIAAVSALAATPDRSAAVRDHVRAVCGTIGRTVRVELPDGTRLTGEAVAIDDSGRLVVTDRSAASGLTAVSVGDVTHLRYA